MNPQSSNAILAGSALRILEGLGILDIIVCTGARNIPLVSSLLADHDQMEEDRERCLYRHFDERAAAFFALGLAKRKGLPAAVVVTSGTAVAELLPAVVEAYYSGVPLVLITADRPRRYRGSGAPQAVEQPGIFDPYARCIDVERVGDWEALETRPWDGASPLHLNVCFEEPSAADLNTTWRKALSKKNVRGALIERNEPSSEFLAQQRDRITEFCGNGQGLLVILGELPESWRKPVERYLVSYGAPIWAEATSGLRESAVLRGRLVLGEPEIPQRILRLGGVPSLRLWRDLETDGYADTVSVLSVSNSPFSGLARKSECIVTPDFPPMAVRQEKAASIVISDDEETLFSAHLCSEPTLVRELSRRIPSSALVYLGNSLPIREWNRAAVTELPHPHCYASRGANGIDGQISTFLGLTEGESESWGIFGDLTTLYDLNAPALLDGLSSGRRRIVVINNGGGRIFSRLSAMSGLSDEDRRVTENRHDRRFSHWAAMWGMEYYEWKAGEPFPDILGDTVVIEAIPDVEKMDAFWMDEKRRRNRVKKQ